MSVLGLGQKPMVMPHYPHMLSEDIGVWSEYLKAPIVPIKEVWYDVRVGKPVPLPVGAGLIDRKIAEGLTRKRIDAVCRVGGGFWVVEVKPVAGYVALGQVVTYHRLFMAEYAPGAEVWPVIICNQVDPDMIDDFDAAGVGVITV